MASIPPDCMAEAQRQLARVLSAPGSPYVAKARPGYKRGVDFYSAATMVRIVAFNLDNYRRVHGSFPSLVQPETFSEKIFWSKFFAELKVPETGDKLATASFIPDEAKHLVSVPQVVWRSARPKLPDPHSIEPGAYYLKANHGCNMNKRIDFPLAADAVEPLEKEFDAHLRNPYGLGTGEWWYTIIPNKIFLERSVTEVEDSLSWYFYVFRGELAFISVLGKLTGQAALFNPDFSLLDYQIPTRPLARFEPLSDALKERMSEAARAIGRPFPFVRVDFLVGDDGEPYLSELTFSPGNALTRWPDDINERLGAKWVLDG